MKTEKVIGVIGRGVVGGAVFKAYTDAGFKTRAWDVVPELCTHNKHETMTSDIVFVCVPTPSAPSGNVDLHILDRVLNELCCELHGEGDGNVTASVSRIFVVCSTVPPGALDDLHDDIDDRVIVAPEFLTAANAYQDYLNPPHLVVGGPGEAVDTFLRTHLKMLKANGGSFVAAYRFPQRRTAQMIKYANNFMLALKVWGANAVYGACQASGVDYSQIASVLMDEKRTGNAYGYAVPGPDGKRGFGGMCFPKDFRGFISIVRRQAGVCAEANQLATALHAILAFNDGIRGE